MVVFDMATVFCQLFTLVPYLRPLSALIQDQAIRRQSFSLAGPGHCARSKICFYR
jgi:hypothetical protein